MNTGPNPVFPQREPELLGQTVVLIGGSAGIGLETARRARSEGADVIITGRNRERLTQAASDVGAQQTAAFDATHEASLERFFQDLPTPIDHVMVTAGGPATARCLRWSQPRCAAFSAITWRCTSRWRASLRKR